MEKILLLPSEGNRFTKFRFRIKSALPLGLARNGVLLHRLKSAQYYKDQFSGKLKYSITFWCGGCFYGQVKDFEFLDHIPEHRVVCWKCEEKALEAQQQPIGRLFSQPVPVGRTVGYKKNRKRFHIEVLYR